MDANDDTVRSLATLLTSDENDDNVTSKIPPATNGVTTKLSPQISKTSRTSQSSGESEKLDDINDSVFGDVPLDEHPVRFYIERIHNDSVTKQPHVPDSPRQSSFQRQASLRSQLSVISFPKEPIKRELKLKIFVAILFVVIITGVSVVLHFAKSKEYDAEIGNKIIVHEDTRKIEYQDREKNFVLSGLFGLGVPEDILPHDCTSDSHRQDHLCLRWHDHSQVDIQYLEQGTSTCYDIAWRSLNKQSVLKDCFELDLDDASWYGGWLSNEQTWPVTNLRVPLQPFITGSEYDGGMFGPVLERYWLSSKGVSIFSADFATPLKVSWNAPDPRCDKTGGDGKLCLAAEYDLSKSTPQPLQDLFLNYTVCISSNIVNVYHLSMTRISAIRNASYAAAPDMSSFSKPVWSHIKSLQKNITENSIAMFGQMVTNLNLSIGVLMLENLWQECHDHPQTNDNFRDLSSVIADLKQSLNCKICVAVDPYISIDSKTFPIIASGDMLVKDAGGVAPGLFHLRGMDYAYQSTLVGALDITQPETVDWLKERINVLQRKCASDFYHFQGGTAAVLPYKAVFNQNGTDNNLFTYNYGVLAWSHSQPAIVDSITHLQTHPVIVRVLISSLTTAIPTVLTLGILGYPYVLPEFREAEMTKEVYIRSIQLSAFLPIMHIGDPSEEYGTEVINLLRKMANVHKDIVHPRVTQNSVGRSPLEPIIRPLWWMVPEDSVALNIDSEFLVGDDILVAPVLKEGTYQRDIYLPKGKWYSKEEKEFIGPVWLKDYTIALSDFAYFTKVPL